MEEIPKPSDPATPENPQTQPPPPPPPAAPTTATAARPPTHTMKRKLDNAFRDLGNAGSNLAHTLRPEVLLQTPGFRVSQAVHEIRKNAQRVRDVYNEMAVEMSKKQSEGQSLPGEHKDGQKNIGKNREEKQGKQHHSERGPEKSLEPPSEVNDSAKSEDGKLTASYVVGGSKLGWNFIMYPGGKPVYYGVTKEERRRSNREKKSAPSKSKYRWRT